MSRKSEGTIRIASRITSGIFLAAALFVASAQNLRAGDGSPAATAESPSGAAAAAAPRSTAGAATAPAPSAAALLELQELKQTVQDQMQKIVAHSKELESERSELADDLDRIGKLQDELTVLAGPGDLASPSPPALLAETEAVASPPVASPGDLPSPATPSAQPSESASETAASSPVAAAPQTVQNQGSVDKRLSDLEARLQRVGPLSFTGDFRFREEPFWGGPTNESLDQNRQRYRMRLYANVDLGDGVTGGFAESSGDVNNPISTNQDITAFYTRKPFSLDQAFIRYNPQFFKYFTIVAGKFVYPWYNTELTWDKDLDPEGFGETLAFDLKNRPVLKRVAIVGYQLPFSQVSGVELTNQSLIASVTYGAQVQSTWQLTPWAVFSAYEALYDFHNADPIALALAKANAKNPVTPLTGALPLAAGSTTQNSIVTTTDNGIVTVGATTAPTGVTTITNAQFASKFDLLDTIGKLDLTTSSPRWPVSFIGNYVQNMGACGNVGNIPSAPANTATARYTQSTNFPCDPHARQAYWAEAQFGRILEKHDIQFGYTRIFIEREAVLSNFDYSEMRQGSNVTEHRGSIFYTVKPNVVIDFIALIGRPLNSSKPAAPEPYLERLQFDVNYAF